MTIEFAKRAASQLLNRGVNAIRVKPEALDDASKALTKDDIRALIKKGSIYALKAKHNLSLNSKMLKQARSEGRRRGVGRRRGTRKVRKGRVWEKKVRSQRRLLKELKNDGKIDTMTFTRFYRLIKGNAYASKGQLLLHMRESGLKLTDDELKKINERIASQFK